MKKPVLIVRWILISVWLSIPIGFLSFYLYDPPAFSAEGITEFLHNFKHGVWLIYIALSAFRGFTLLPSTPLVLAGTMLFPSHPFAVLAVSMAGILLSSTMIYYFSEFLGFDDYFEEHKPELSHNIKQRLEQPFGFLIVAGWAFFPFIPTDLVCYLAGTTRMHFGKFISAVAIGESILCSIYIFFGGSILRFWN
ncbi:MAG TPA: VTT domain-containing protein [Pyrinomonadaceae bacterium]|nr:TVP38/TMEM64 family protein [Chloracidobacterium sp.]MBP9935304.1 TVP38/TMEM64 family protein [Pyrinomonadaceae bacterium]MBK7804546.1 TVP38/TMEM64 family protein [Chloracidobacterium sp.]MBK9438947.1 TVP38/TMEM64 family protein [Chloracidobacterium sp.]MBK9768843.1 TVP38/TMEM64 family protein [Chloracidobacterium sp.]